MSEVEAGQQAVETPTNDNYVLHSEEAAKEQAEAEAKPEESADGQDAESEAPKKKGGFQKKIERLKTEYDAVSERAARAEAELERYRSGNQQPKQESPKSDGRPKVDDFEQYHDYLKADALYDLREERKAEKAEDERVKTHARAVETYQTKVEALTERAEAFRESAPDFDDVIEAAEKAGLTPPHIVQAVLDSEIGEQVGYYLAKNPAELVAMQRMDEKQLAKAIGKIEARLESQPQEATAKTTKAPAPISPIKNTAKSTKSLDELPYEEYKREMDKRDREARR